MGQFVVRPSRRRRPSAMATIAITTVPMKIQMPPMPASFISSQDARCAEVSANLSPSTRRWLGAFGPCQ